MKSRNSRIKILISTDLTAKKSKLFILFIITKETKKSHFTQCEYTVYNARSLESVKVRNLSVKTKDCTKCTCIHYCLVILNIITIMSVCNLRVFNCVHTKLI